MSRSKNIRYDRTVTRIKNVKKKKSSRNNLRAKLIKDVKQNGDY